MEKAKNANKPMTPDEEKMFRDEMIELYKERELTEPGFREIRESFIRTISKPIQCPDYNKDECAFKREMTWNIDDPSSIPEDIIEEAKRLGHTHRITFGGVHIMVHYDEMRTEVDIYKLKKSISLERWERLNQEGQTEEA